MSEPNYLMVEEAADRIVKILLEFKTASERSEVLCKVDDDVCISCGDTNCGGWCDYDSVND